MPKKGKTTGLTLRQINDGEDRYYAPFDKGGNIDLSKKILVKHGEKIPKGYVEVPLELL